MTAVYKTRSKSSKDIKSFNTFIVIFLASRTVWKLNAIVICYSNLNGLRKMLNVSKRQKIWGQITGNNAMAGVMVVSVYVVIWWDGTLFIIWTRMYVYLLPMLVRVFFVLTSTWWKQFKERFIFVRWFQCMVIWIVVSWLGGTILWQEDCGRIKLLTSWWPGSTERK
jgi:hypothetical protein